MPKHENETKDVCVMLPWTMSLSIMMQTVLISAIRGPDGVRKDHPVKRLMRFYRRSVLRLAFGGGQVNSPYTPGGGSFTGPIEPVFTMEQIGNGYIDYMDELPHHFTMHMIQAARIVGNFHDDVHVGVFWLWWHDTIVN